MGTGQGWRHLVALVLRLRSERGDGNVAGNESARGLSRNRGPSRDDPPSETSADPQDDAVQRSANRLIRFSGDIASTRLTVDVAGLNREDAIRAASGKVAPYLSYV
jgi:hypothetical protein